MLHAITREVSPKIADCELTHLQRAPIRYDLAARQHAAYQRALTGLGAKIIRLPPRPEHADGVFVEDTAIVLDELAVICRMGAESRRGEEQDTSTAIAPYRSIARLAYPATLEGGDVVRAGRTLYVGESSRTNTEGIAQLRHILVKHDYKVIGVPVTGCLHLKSACAYLGGKMILVNPEWVDETIFRGYEILHVPLSEPNSADVLPIGSTIIATADCPELQGILRKRGFAVCAVDLSELQKAEAGTTCMSILFDAG